MTARRSIRTFFRGTYRFRVIASNNSGVWNEQGDTLEFSIAPAYYQTNWFRAVCAALFLTLLWAAYQLRVRQLHHEFAMTLEARVGERTRIARDLHDTLLQSFHGLLLRFQTVSQLLPERPAEAKERLDSAIEQAAEAITEGPGCGARIARFHSPNQRPRARNKHSRRRTRTTQATANPQLFVWQWRANREICIPSSVMKSTGLLPKRCGTPFGTRRRSRSRSKSAMTTSNSGCVCGTMEKALIRRFSLRQGSEGHYGLRGMRERAKLIGGKLVVWSEVDAGTEVELRVPASAAYATARETFVVIRIARQKRRDEAGDS